jgi:hypothetical protein
VGGAHRATVRVVDPEGLPVRDAVVLPDGGATGRTGEDGRCRFDDVGLDRVLVDVDHPEYETAFGADVSAGPDAPESVVVLSRGATWSAVVVDPGGAPVAGARVAVWSYFAPRTAVSDDNGRFTVVGIIRDLNAPWAVRSSRGLGAAGMRHVDEPWPQRVELTPLGRLKFLIVDDRGRPLSVRAASLRPDWIATLSAHCGAEPVLDRQPDGWCVLDGLTVPTSPHGVFVHLLVDVGRRLLWRVRLREMNLVDDAPIRATLPPSVDLTVRLVDGGRRPVAGASVHVSAGTSFSCGSEVMPVGPIVASEADANGLVKIVGVPCGPVKLWISRGAEGPVRRTLVVDADTSSPVTVEI